ncbi:MAG TPA: SDR family oxidoreductase [Phycisphaerae bacterium]|nr:SDR family oxidoreductase [Phycisphaerae bacterium]HRY71155.1 SDR family oxidoreductase [Phycisphaerae bacterium]HSA30066.1 SDR family oxidoreductase [Phycisphaerae bacterium]
MAGPMCGKVAVVTGAASGIGRASAIAFGQEGAKVVVSDIDAKGGDETVAKVMAAGGEALFAPCDVTNGAEVEALLKKTVAAYGRLDFAHNNAGIVASMGPTADCTEEDWDRTIRVNLKGVWLCMKHEIRQMLAQRGGVIVNTSSTAGVVGSKGASAYAAASHGIVGLTKTAALEYAEAGIRVNAICPGNTRTPMIERVLEKNPQVEPQMIGRIPLRRMATPEEIAATVVWLCSDAAAFVTGHTLIADGGVTAS